MADRCPFCKSDPYEYVDIGVGYEPVAVSCCDLGIALLQYNDKHARRLLEYLHSHSPRRRAIAAKRIKELNGC